MAKLGVVYGAAFLLYIVSYAFFAVALVRPVYRVRPHTAEQVCPASANKTLKDITGLALQDAVRNGQVSLDVFNALGECQKPLPEFTQTISESIKMLLDEASYVPAVLIILFTIVVPIIKGICLLCIFFFARKGTWGRLFSVAAFLGKWAMVDAFVITILCAFLRSKMLPVDFIIENGFYYFITYVLLSLAGITVHESARMAEKRENDGRSKRGVVETRGSEKDSPVAHKKVSEGSISTLEFE